MQLKLIYGQCFNFIVDKKLTSILKIEMLKRVIWNRRKESDEREGHMR